MIERASYPAGHVIHMSLDRAGTDRHIVSLAACDCGWKNTVPWPGHHVDQDEAIESHWREAEGR